jgi:hypothetical protein
MLEYMMLPKYLFVLLFSFVLFNCSKHEKQKNIPYETTIITEEDQNNEIIQLHKIEDPLIEQILGVIEEININLETMTKDDKLIEYKYITGSSGYEIRWDVAIETSFASPKSKNEIFYSGAYRGHGLLWVNLNGNKTEILEAYFRYSPWISWHGENIAEIVIPTGSPFTHSYYYNFTENTLSEGYAFPLYYDVDNNFLLIWGNEYFELYDLKTNTLIKTYTKIKKWMSIFWPIIKWHIEKINGNTIIMYWEELDTNKDNGIITFDYH